MVHNHRNISGIRDHRDTNEEMPVCRFQGADHRAYTYRYTYYILQQLRHNLGGVPSPRHRSSRLRGIVALLGPLLLSRALRLEEHRVHLLPLLLGEVRILIVCHLQRPWQPNGLSNGSMHVGWFGSWVRRRRARRSRCGGARARAQRLVRRTRARAVGVCRSCSRVSCVLPCVHKNAPRLGIVKRTA